MLDTVNEYWTQALMLVESQLGVEDKTLAAAFLSVAMASLVLIVVWRIVRVVGRRFTKRVRNWEGGRIPAFKIQDQEILSAHEITDLFAKAVGWITNGALLVLLYFYLNIVLSVYPPTQGLGQQLVGYAVSALKTAVWGVILYIPDFVMLLVLFFLARALVNLVHVFFRGIASGRIRIRGFYPEWSNPTFELARVLIYAFTAVAIYPYLPGSGSPAFQAMGLFVGVLVSLGSSGAVANLISGIVLTYMRPFKVGDRVKIADACGDVIEKTTFVTRVRTPKNVEITIPNGMVMSNHIINFSSHALEKGLILHTGVTIGYDIPWQKVHELLTRAAELTDEIIEEPKPFVLQTSLDDFYVAYELNAYTKDAGAMMRTYSDLHRNILDQFNEAGIEIASPHFLALRDGHHVNLPEDYLPSDYTPPAFRFAPLDWLAGGIKKSKS